MSTRPKSYVLVVGHGRSGTNWLLDILDASPETHCRNEPNEVPNSALEYVRDLWFSENAINHIVPDWDQKISLARISMSERDHRITTPKNHIYTFAQKSGLSGLPSSSKARKLLRLFVPTLRQGEWIVPWWISPSKKLNNSCTILKINMLAASFVDWHTKQYPQIPILHIVRHPGGYLNSSITRFFSKCSPEELEKELKFYRNMLRTATISSPKWQAVVGNIEAMNLIETVAWFWRINNEIIYSNGKNKPNYHLLVYEKIVSSPLELSKQIYHHCGLQWNKKTEKIILNGLNKSVWGSLSGEPSDIAKAWETKLTPEHKTLINKILNNSKMKSWWETEG